MFQLSQNLGTSTSWKPQGMSRPGIAAHLPYKFAYSTNLNVGFFWKHDIIHGAYRCVSEYEGFLHKRWKPLFRNILARSNKLNHLCILVLKCNNRCHKGFDWDYFHTNCSVWLGKVNGAKKLYLHLKHIQYKLKWVIWIWSLHGNKYGSYCLLGWHIIPFGRNLTKALE